jgi:hypothetical protein
MNESQVMEELQYRPINRGIKLRISTLPPRPQLLDCDSDTELVQVGKRRTYVRKRKSREDPYSLVNIQDIWRVRVSRQDFKTEQIRSAFRNRYCFIY